MPWPQTGATQYHAQLELPDKDRAIKGLVVSNNRDLEPQDPQNGLALGCYQPSPAVLIVFPPLCTIHPFINIVVVSLGPQPSDNSAIFKFTQPKHQTYACSKVCLCFTFVCCEIASLTTPVDMIFKGINYNKQNKQ